MNVIVRSADVLLKTSGSLFIICTGFMVLLAYLLLVPTFIEATEGVEAQWIVKPMLMMGALTTLGWYMLSAFVALWWFRNITIGMVLKVLRFAKQSTHKG